MLETAPAAFEVPADALLSVEDLRVHFKLDTGAVVKAVDGVSWYVRPGETLGIVGESGSGKSVSAMTIMGLVPSPPATFPSGKIMFRGQDLLSASESDLRKLRGKDISMIFQDPLSALNPVFKVGHQIAEVIQVHEKVGKKVARARAVDLLGEVGIPNHKARAEEYPHQYSGGMRQRAMIAMALALNPNLLLADEPTTALDVTVQAQIMELLFKLQEDRGTAIVLITHDLGLVASSCDRILVMYAGRVAETSDCDTIFYEPRHAYTQGLLSSLARLDQRRTERLEPIPGQPPNLAKVPPGCAFHERCRFATEICRTDRPELSVQNGREDHLAACHHSDEVAEVVSASKIASDQATVDYAAVRKAAGAADAAARATRAAGASAAGASAGAPPVSGANPAVATTEARRPAPRAASASVAERPVSPAAERSGAVASAVRPAPSARATRPVEAAGPASRATGSPRPTPTARPTASRPASVRPAPSASARAAVGSEPSRGARDLTERPTGPRPSSVRATGTPRPAAPRPATQRLAQPTASVRPRPAHEETK